MKRIIDQNGRLFGKISIIDILFILVVAAVCAAFYVKFNVLDVTSKAVDTVPVTYSITISGVRDYTVNSLQVGDLLYDNDNSGGQPVGKITYISVQDAVRTVEKTDGTIVNGPVEGCYDVTLTLIAEGIVSGGRYLVNRTYDINMNSERIFNTKYAVFTATITGVSS
ncbi:MAG TPA: DUF4330 domain-containing protein [Papillibacter sp.]|nr:DUF4330 domain-containing protein [Papillibacter sp.]